MARLPVATSNKYVPQRRWILRWVQVSLGFGVCGEGGLAAVYGVVIGWYLSVDLDD